MLCDSCKEAIYNRTDGDKTPLAHRVAKIAQASGPVCPCEECKVGEDSPGPVADDEVLHFIVTDPQAIEGDKIKPFALSQVYKDGLSTIRSTAPVEEYILVLERLIQRSKEANNEERYFDSVLEFPASLVRYDEAESRLLCVYDTSLTEQPNHVDLMVPGADKLTKKDVAALTKKLRELLTKRISGSDLFNGELTKYMRS